MADSDDKFSNDNPVTNQKKLNKIQQPEPAVNYQNTNYKNTNNKYRPNISLLANDINNQLSGIIGNAELLKKDNLEPFERSKLICNIVSCAKLTTILTEKIIQIEGIDAAKPDYADSGTIRDQSYSSGDNNTVLVIDDEEVIRNVAKSLLENSGYEVITASNGKEGIEIFKKQSSEILCVLLDLTMPYLPGNLVYAKLKAIDDSVRVFLMSGLNLQQVKQQFESEDIAGFIKKPFMLEELLDLIASARKVSVH